MSYNVEAWAIPVKDFNITLPTNGGVSIILVGASRSGKTTLMKYLYNKFFKHTITIMFSMNRHADIYKDLSSKVLVCEEYRPEIVKEAHMLNKEHGNEYPFLFISDDYVDAKIKNSPEITRLMTIMRNANINSIFSFQGRTLMSAVGRNNANYICILKQQTPQEWVNVIKEFLSMYFPPDMTMKEMVQYCVEATKGYQFFMIDNINGECYLTRLTRKQIGGK